MLRLPSRETLEYARLLLTVLLLVCAIPVLAWHFLEDPRGARERAVNGLGGGLL